MTDYTLKSSFPAKLRSQLSLCDFHGTKIGSIRPNTHLSSIFRASMLQQM